MKTVTAGDADRQYSSILREVVQGQAFTVLSRGKPVATIAPLRSDDLGRDHARRSLLDRLRKQAPSGSRDWTRDELYER